jgi:hypothetical protein
MASEYRLDIRDNLGIKRAELTGRAGGAHGGFLSLAYRRVVNAPGMLTFEVEGNSAIASQLGHRWIVEVWRRNQAEGIAWYRDFTTLVLHRDWTYTDHDVCTVQCPGILWLLSTRHVLYRAGTANRSTFSAVPAETIIKTLVTYNLGASATTANSRVRAGVISGVSSATDAAGGTALSVNCAYDNVLEACQAVALIGGGDFDLVPNTNPPTYEFRFYSGQLGTDRTATVVFALEYGNMAEPEYDNNRIEEKTVCVVLGSGTGSNRTTVIRTGTDYAVTTNDVETVAQYSNSATTAVLNAHGDKVLKEKQQGKAFKFKGLQTPACLYGKHWFLGDKVTARYGTIVEVTRKIVAVNVAFGESNGETVTPEFGDV